METDIFSSPEKFFECVFDPKKEISMIYPINKDILRVNHRVKRDYVKENKSSNIVIALYTTAEARLKLYRYMKMVEDIQGCEIAYTDTDSVNFSCVKKSIPCESIPDNIPSPCWC
jgi:hypothetical protein